MDTSLQLSKCAQEDHSFTANFSPLPQQFCLRSLSLELTQRNQKPSGCTHPNFSSLKLLICVIACLQNYIGKLVQDFYRRQTFPANIDSILSGTSRLVWPLYIHQPQKLSLNSALGCSIQEFYHRMKALVSHLLILDHFLGKYVYPLER